MVKLQATIALASVIIGASPALAAPAPVPKLVSRSIGAASSGVHPRPNIRDVLADDKQKECLLKVLKAVQAKKSGDESWDEIAGIHGLPSRKWSGDHLDGPDKPLLGYCAHGLPAFPTWHRPYLLLFETACYNAAKSECDSSVAANWRLPYWDWAEQGKVSIPEEFTQPTINFDGSTQRNPLYNYNFPNGNPISDDKDSVNGWLTTLRSPTGSSGNWKDNEAGAQSAVEGLVGQQITSKVWNVLTNTKTWAEFSNKQIDNEDGSFNSIETCHDYIHSSVGGSAGTMTFTTSSSYDPIFYFHHSNVDRLYCMWQKINSDAWIEDNQQSGFSASDPLYPFPKSSSAYFTSNDIKDPTKWGYTYADCNGTEAQTIARANALYGTTTNQLNSASSSDSRKRSEDYTASNEKNDYAGSHGKVPEHKSDYGESDSQAPEKKKGDEPCDDGVSNKKYGKGHGTYKNQQEDKDKEGHMNGDHDRHGGKGDDDRHGRGGRHGDRKRPGRKHDGPEYGRRLATNPIWDDFKPHLSKVVRYRKEKVEDKEVEKKDYNEYTCNIKVNSEALGGKGFKVLFYVGDSCNNDGWAKGKYYDNDDYVGYYTAFRAGSQLAMGMNITIGGTVPLTTALLNLVTQDELDDLDEESVTAYLKAHMCFKIVDDEGKECHPKEIEGLGIHVVRSEVTLPETVEKLPIYGKPSKCMDVYQ